VVARPRLPQIRRPGTPASGSSSHGFAAVREDDFVGQTDLDFVLSDWGLGTPPTAPVPEPATLGLLAIGGALLLKRRR